VSQKSILVWQLWQSAPSLALAAEATTNLIIVVLTWKALFNQMGLPSFGIHPIKMPTCPDSGIFL
jgi:hypothetical protein